MHSGQLVVGRYRLEEQVGRGGNGTVWRATDEELGRTVAVKRALPRDDGQQVRLQRREAKILAKLNHPNVVTLYDMVNDGAEWWLVMEYIPARSLAEHGTLPPDRVARIGAQIARALQAVHAAGVLHRDIKPGNVLLFGDDHAKLGDFGISQVVEGDVTLTDTALVVGTPGYLAPEVANGEDPTRASDVFSLGAMLFATVEGRSPYGVSGNPLVLIRRAAAGDIATSEHGGALAPVLSALMHPDPARRPTTAQAERMLEGAADRPPERRTLPVRRAAVMSGATLAALTVIGWLLANPGHQVVRPRPQLAVGDGRTADPCALTDPAALTRFGEAVEETHYGNFNRCDVIVRSGDSEVDVRVEFLNPPESPPPGRIEQAGPLGIARRPADGDQCGRTLYLTGRYRVEITARQDGDGPADLCAMAEAASANAVAVLSGGGVPRRSTLPERTSLIKADACALLDAAALARFPGVDALHPQAGFAGWQCRWLSTTSRSSLLLRFDRHQPLTADDGRPVRLGGREAFVAADGYGDGTCQVSVVHRRSVDDRAQPIVELLLVVVTGPDPGDRLCELATGLAAPAAARLPPP